MEARLYSTTCVVAAVCLMGAAYRTTNFVVSAPTPELAKAIGNAAEVYREDLSQEWLGHELPDWTQPCPIKADVSPHKGAGGATSFMFERGRPFGWRMNIQGPRERILDSVLPHEVTHTIFATHFGRPLPRWADEGACTTVEHSSERGKQQQMLVRFLTSRPYSRGIPFNRMFAMREYPPDILPLYAQGYSVARYLIGRGGKRKFVDYVDEGMRTNEWPQVTRKFYDFQSLGELQASWLTWVGSGSPDTLSPNSTSDVQVATAAQLPGKQQAPIYRAQNADNERTTDSGTNIVQAQPHATADRRFANVYRGPRESGSGSWYVRQNEKASGQRTHSRARDVFHPVDTGEGISGRSIPLVDPTAADNKSAHRVILEWSRDDRQRPVNRKPVRFDAPLSRPTTVWR